MPATSPGHNIMINRDAKRTAVSGASSDGHKAIDISGPQTPYAAYGKIHIKDMNLIRFESAPERICHGGGIGPSSV